MGRMLRVIVVALVLHAGSASACSPAQPSAFAATIPGTTKAYAQHAEDMSPGILTAATPVWEYYYDGWADSYAHKTDNGHCSESTCKPEIVRHCDLQSNITNCLGGAGTNGCHPYVTLEAKFVGCKDYDGQTADEWCSDEAAVKRCKAHMFELTVLAEQQGAWFTQAARRYKLDANSVCILGSRL